MHRMNRYRLLVLFVTAAMFGATSLAGAKGTTDTGRTDEKKPAAAAGKSGSTTKAGQLGKGHAGKSSKRDAKSSKHKDSKKSAKSRSSKSHDAKSEPTKEKSNAPAARPTTLASVDPSAIVTEIEPTSVSSDDIATVREAAGLIRRGRASEASALQPSVRDPAARKLIEWLILRHESNGASFARYAAFIRSNPTWPSIPLFRRRAEGYLWHEHSDPATEQRNARPSRIAAD